MQELDVLLLSLDETISKVSLKVQLIYQLFFFYTYNFYNLNILQYHMIYHIHTHNY